MRELKEQYFLDYSWKDVSLAIWKKYPNPHADHVKSTDIIDRYVDSNGNLHTYRLFSCIDPIPWPINRLVNDQNDDGMYVLEYSVVDPLNETHTSHSINVSLSSLTSNVESLCYKSSGTNRTSVDLDLKIKSKIRFICDIDKFQLDRYIKNKSKGREALLYTLNQLNSNHPSFPAANMENSNLNSSYLKNIYPALNCHQSKSDDLFVKNSSNFSLYNMLSSFAVYLKDSVFNETTRIRIMTISALFAAALGVIIVRR